MNLGGGEGESWLKMCYKPTTSFKSDLLATLQKKE